MIRSLQVAFKINQTKMKLAISMDDTGSMHGCRREVRRRAKGLIRKLEGLSRLVQANSKPPVEIALIIHGDYCDGAKALEYVDFTTDFNKLIAFLEDTKQKGGGDAPEFYEMVLHKAQSLDWKGEPGVLILMGDDVPHGPKYKDNHLGLVWEDEADALHADGKTVHAVQCLNRTHATPFYRGLSERCGGLHIPLDQFEDAEALILGVAYREVGQFEKFERDLRTEKEDILTRALEVILDLLAGRKVKARKPKKHKLEPVNPARFQRFRNVPKGMGMKTFIVDEMGLKFYPGCGFYPLDARTETVQERKEIVLRDKVSGDMFTGEAARELIGLPYGTRGRVAPNLLDDYDVFVQSTSPGNRVLRSSELLWDLEEADRRETGSGAKPRR